MKKIVDIVSCSDLCVNPDDMPDWINLALLDGRLQIVDKQTLSDGVNDVPVTGFSQVLLFEDKTVAVVAGENITITEDSITIHNMPKNGDCHFQIFTKPKQTK